MENASVDLQKVIREMKLDKLYYPKDKKIEIVTADLNRPGLQITGFF